MDSMTIDGRRLRGDASRRVVMQRAVDIASVDGLAGLSIGGLASETGMSKGGVVALFGSKEQLQLATVEAARQIFTHTVIRPALTQPSGMPRLRALIDNWINYSESRVFSGGCFFAAASAEVGSQHGAVRDAVAAAMTDWTEFIAGAVSRAVDRDDLPESTDPAQLAFEITAILDGANRSSLLHDSAAPYARARTALGAYL
ncbi:TetR/AcrR family transcriptional regulator [soil metagenome]